MSTFEVIVAPTALHAGGNNWAKEVPIWLVHIHHANSMEDVAQLEVKIISTSTTILIKSSVVRPARKQQQIGGLVDI